MSELNPNVHEATETQNEPVQEEEIYEQLTLSNGTKLKGHALTISDKVVLFLYEITMSDAFDLLKVPANVQSISYIYYGTEGVITGYSKLYTITEEDTGSITVGLKKVQGSV